MSHFGSGQGDGPSRSQFLVLGALSLLLVVSLALMVRSQRPGDETAASAPAGRAPARDEEPRLRKLPAGAQVVVIGDSWSAGYGAELPESQNWASVAAERLGWSLEKFALGGAAYISEGTYEGYQGNYRYCLRMARDQVSDPRDVELVVLQGGINDTDYRLRAGRLTNAFEATIATARRLFPKAQMLVLGPMAPSDFDETGVDQVDATFAAAAHGLAIPYIDAYQLGWLSESRRDRLVDKEIGHPNTKGYAEIGRKFARYVRQLSR